MLRKEFSNLFSSLFYNPEKHLMVVNALATKAKGMTREDILTITKLSNAGSSTKILEELEEMTDTIDVTKTIIKQSLKTDFKDYEDAIQYYCALSKPKIDFIITRDTKDFKKSTLPVLTPSEAIGSLDN